MSTNNKKDAQMEAIKSSIEFHRSMGNPASDILQSIIKSQEELVIKQQSIIDSLTAIAGCKNEEIEALKKTIEQMQADRADELESLEWEK